MTNGVRLQLRLMLHFCLFSRQKHTGLTEQTPKTRGETSKHRSGPSLCLSLRRVQGSKRPLSFVATVKMRANARVQFLCPDFKSFSLQAVSNSRPFKYSPPHVLNSETSRVIEGQKSQSGDFVTDAEAFRELPTCTFERRS